MRSRFLSLALAGATALAAQAPMRYLHPPPESALDVRYDYPWQVLRTALERTRARWGPFTLEAGGAMPEKRQRFELIHATGQVTVMYLGDAPELERELVPVRIPVDKNLEGYCVFLIRKKDQWRFAPGAIRSLADLRKFSFGQGLGWIDVDILRQNGFRVVTGSDYEGLFSMLANRRFDVFLRSAVEVLDEFDRRVEALPTLGIEENYLLYYPMPMYFWFPRTPEGTRLAARAREGMDAMLADGTYDRIFHAFQDPKIARLGLARRKIFRIPNPMLGPETPFKDRRLWFQLPGR